MPVDIPALTNFFSVLRLYGNKVKQSDDLTWEIDQDIVQAEQDLRSKNIECAKTGTRLIIEIKNQGFCKEVTCYYEDRFIQTLTFGSMEDEFILFTKEYEFIVHYNLVSQHFEKSTNINAEFLLLYRNCIAYFRLYKAFKSSDFSQHYNEAKNHIVLYTSSRGIFKLEYNTAAPKFPEEITDKVNNLILYSEQIFFKVSLIHAIIDCSTNKSVGNLKQVILDSQMIIDSAKQGYDIASRQFDFDKVRNLLQKEKDKYFSNVRDVTSKFFGQIVAIPISASATVFASYKVNGDVNLNLLILAGFILFTTLYFFIQSVYYGDLSGIKIDFERDFKLIKERSGIDPLEVEREAEKLRTKISDSKLIIWISVGSAIVLTIAITIYILNQICAKKGF